MLNRCINIVPEEVEVVVGYNDFGIITETVPYEQAVRMQQAKEQPTPIKVETKPTPKSEPKKENAGYVCHIVRLPEFD